MADLLAGRRSTCRQAYHAPGPSAEAAPSPEAPPTERLTRMCRYAPEYTPRYRFPSVRLPCCSLAARVWVHCSSTVRDRPPQTSSEPLQSLHRGGRLLNTIMSAVAKVEAAKMSMRNEQGK